MSPSDHEQLVTAKSKDDAYLLPLNAGRIGNLLPIPHVAVPDGAPLVGATGATELVVADDVYFYISRSHGTGFTEGVAQVLVRASVAFVVRCPQAWCSLGAFGS